MFANRFFATASLEGPLFKRVSREERTFHFFADRIKRQNVFEEVGRVVPTAVYERRQSGRLRSSFSKLFSTALASETTATPKVQGSALDPSESFLSGTNAAVLEDMYEKWMTDPSSVDPSWAQFFSNVDREVAPGEAVPFMSRALETAKSGVSLTSSSVTSQEAVLKAASDTVKIMSIIKAYRHRGHLIADLDPLKLDEELGFYKKVIPSGTKRDFEPSSYGFTEADMDREFVVNGELPGKDVSMQRKVAFCLFIYFMIDKKST
jgi:hypothetical protein